MMDARMEGRDPSFIVHHSSITISKGKETQDDHEESGRPSDESVS
jgi:hypothetical protein